MSTLQGAQGFAIGTKAKSMRDPSARGFSFAMRIVSDPAGARGFVFGTDYNTVLSLRPTNTAVLLAGVTISISWAGHNAEAYTPTTFFIANRSFPLNTAITVLVGGTGIVSSSVTFTPTSVLPATIDVPITAYVNPSAYRRRRHSC
jgi:hypothetical protein